MNLCNSFRVIDSDNKLTGQQHITALNTLLLLHHLTRPDEDSCIEMVLKRIHTILYSSKMEYTHTAVNVGKPETYTTSTCTLSRMKTKNYIDLNAQRYGCVWSKTPSWNFVMALNESLITEFLNHTLIHKHQKHWEEIFPLYIKCRGFQITFIAVY